mmetsp:Transcript_18271/g.38162  ORF Transcript_18271/g.38162 Transcript_18271/m.38162 type:complete len:278 (-) Transcript_18271:3145-3978(-)
MTTSSPSLRMNEVNSGKVERLESSNVLAKRLTFVGHGTGVCGPTTLSSGWRVRTEVFPKERQGSRQTSGRARIFPLLFNSETQGSNPSEPSSTTMVTSDQDSTEQDGSSSSSSPGKKLIESISGGDVRASEEIVVGNPEAVQFVDDMGRSPLHYAAGMGIPSLCRFVLEAGAEIDQRDAAGLTPLHMAAGYVRSATVKALLELGADPTCAAEINGVQETPLSLVTKLIQNEKPKKMFVRKNERYENLQDVITMLEAFQRERESTGGVETDSTNPVAE